MADPLHDRRITIDEYLAWENAQEWRHEYVDGHAHAMSGVTRRHSQIVTNISLILGPLLRGSGCRLHIVDLKLRYDPVVYYPDVMVACGAEPEDEYVEVDPVLVVEVLSRSTAHVDRREKLLVYKSIPGLLAYLIVEQDYRRVEHHRRDQSGEWRHRTVENSGSIELAVPPSVLTLDDIYEKVRLPSPDEIRRIREEAERYG